MRPEYHLFRLLAKNNTSEKMLSRGYNFGPMDTGIRSKTEYVHSYTFVTVKLIQYDTQRHVLTHTHTHTQSDVTPKKWTKTHTRTCTNTHTRTRTRTHWSSDRVETYFLVVVRLPLTMRVEVETDLKLPVPPPMSIPSILPIPPIEKEVKSTTGKQTNKQKHK